nr:uncharacterized protein si:ch211-159e12.5 [Nothobranchius furzeri]XP_054606033.1 uncharacterized protein si:ch211-159e12.5 [Nothobranchius furzeri]
MDFWSDNQGQPHVYTRYGTAPGINCVHNCHVRHERETRNWTVAGSKTAPHGYTHWMDPSISSPHLPIMLDSWRHQVEYQQHKGSDREWASHRAVRDYERGYTKDGWQRRWEPSNTLGCNQEFPAKRNDSSYRELEAWAARYSHSLPRRRRLEAELLGTSQGLVGRDPRYRTGPQTHLQHVQLAPCSMVSELWERGRRQHAPSTTPAPDRNYMKENSSYQRGIFSQPPEYVGPPPYNNPLKTSPIKDHDDTSLEQLGKRQVYWSQLTPRKQAGAADVENREFRKSVENKSCHKLVGLKQEEAASQEANLTKAQKSQMLTGSMSALQHPSRKQETSSKIIEGRKFRLNKKTGGMTIFCLVSRIAGASGTSSLPVCTSQTSIQSPERREVSFDLKDRSEISQLADEVDFRAPSCIGKEMLEDNLGDRDVISLENIAENNDSTSVGQAGPSVQPVSLRYPLWREPGSTSSAVSNHKMDKDVSKVNTEDRKGLLVIDTSCVVVKVELIPSPKKVPVQNLFSSTNDQTFISSDLNQQLEDDPPSQQNKDALKTSEALETDLDSEKEKKVESDVPLPSVQPPLLSEPDTLEERAERILGICLTDGVVEQQPEGEEPNFDLKDEEAELSPEDAETQNPAEVLQPEETDCLENSKDFRPLVAEDENKGVADLSQDTADQHLKTSIEEADETQLESTSKTDQKQDKTLLVEDESPKSPDFSHSLFPPLHPSFSSALTESNTRVQLDPDLVTSSALTSTSPFSLLQLPSPPSESADSSFDFTSHTDQLPSPTPLEATIPATDEESGAEHEHEKSESKINRDSLTSDMKEEVMSQQKDTGDAAKEPQKHPDVKTLPQQLGCGEAEDEKSSKESNEGITDIIQTPEAEEEREENPSDGQDVILLQQQWEFNQHEDVLRLEESDAIQSCDLITGLSQDTNAHIQINTEILLTHVSIPSHSSALEEESLLGELPLPSIPTLPSASPESKKDRGPLLEMVSVCNSPLIVDIPAAHTAEITTPVFDLDPCDESTQFPCSASSSPPVSPPTTTSHDENLSPHFSPSAAHKEKAQYPKTLRDVVNHIRKHTAPNSESEDEEVSELWDPEVVCEDVSYLDVVVDKKLENMDEVGEPDVLKKRAEIGHMEEDGKEPHDDEDTQSCGGPSRHVSDDRVLIVDEKTRLHANIERSNEEFDSAQGDICCSSDAQEETSSGSEEEAEPNKSGDSEEHPAEEENVTNQTDSNEVKG